MLPEHQEKVKHITKDLSSIAKTIMSTHKSALEYFQAGDASSLANIKEQLKGIPEEANRIDNEVVKVLALFEPEASELRSLVATLKITNELIRIASAAVKYSKHMRINLEHTNFEFKYIKDYIEQLHIATINSLEYAISSIESQDEEFEDLYRKVMIEESKTDDLLSLIEKDVLINNSDSHLEEYVNILVTVRKLERAADHSVNIAKLIYYAKKGGKIESF